MYGFTLYAHRCCKDEHKHLHHLKAWSSVSVVCSLMCAGLSTHTLLHDQKRIHHIMGMDVCTIRQGYMAGHMMSLKRATKGKPANQTVPVDQTLAMCNHAAASFQPLTLHHSHRRAAGDPRGHFCHTPHRRLDHPLHQYPEFSCSQQESK